MWFIFLLMGCLAAYLLYLIPDWSWWNPYDSKKGLVSGEVIKENQRLYDLAAKDTLFRQETDKRHRDETTQMEKNRDRSLALLAEIRKLKPQKPKFFGGSTLTTPRPRVAPLEVDDQGNIGTGVLGTITTGVSATPKEWLKRYPPRVDTRRSGSTLRPKK